MRRTFRRGISTQGSATWLEDEQCIDLENRTKEINDMRDKAKDLFARFIIVSPKTDYYHFSEAEEKERQEYYKCLISAVENDLDSGRLALDHFRYT